MDRYRELPLAAQTAYAQLVDAALALELARDIAHLNGSFGCKNVRGARHWYFGFRDLDGQVRNLYVGPDNDRVRALVERARTQSPLAPLEPLARAAGAYGCAEAMPKHVRVIRRLSEYGFFRAGGVLVGTHAFIAMGNMLGVRWREGERTVDIDFAHAGRNVSIALPADVRSDVHGALSSFESGFIPLTQFNGVSGASYRHAEEPEFQLDFLTTLHRGKEAPFKSEHLNVTLQPLRFMEFLLVDVKQAVLFGRTGMPVVVIIPAPERYAVHKLLVYAERKAEYRAKSTKDLLQAAALISWHKDHLKEAVQLAWNDALSRGKGWKTRADAGLAAIGRIAPELDLADWLVAPSGRRLAGKRP